ncbi:N12 class adenine-specific DNA methylase [Dysgonomonas sp. PFB1-18]|uniref:N-6 DNA methylase n=1 Tax=unclassified Dysgonomonas TaxID=2630389 RepID=UPI0024745F85|nr:MULTISPECIES: N-6 DNA methylase [unclassified Dysgonomonas]MDH6309459.1 N12 class adenine-specific DNA methylase [Dysgonomonas sp. PF1-14]MDH6340869.1 N12 class adenine-specific DNA methylase [Dysgonomonas sp. PF1-16]MDH6382518.1 N12 class adenine-specific DNA methylase [Dysgonomonas sp. PFB1-18]MDH6399838.1 N12 class adenine-specific DNA methylase [Dysgonomonas sp. PF1-23]
MAYNKKKHLQDNILAIQTVFRIREENRKASEAERILLKKYSGFGGLKCVLRQCESPEDKNSWPLSEQELYEDTKLLFSILRQYSRTEEEYKKYRDSLQASILSAFYTPPEVAEAIAKALTGTGIKANTIIEPSAGAGAFTEAFSVFGRPVSCYEKDLLTAGILSALHPEDIVVAGGFETIDERSLNHFDIACSNIPFGDYRVYDPLYVSEKDETKKRCCKDIHSYFFVKAVDAVREGGLIAFITSQGVMDSPKNEYLRKWLMDKCRLVSAIRLPDNLFMDNANTQVPSDLVILQKDSHKTERSTREYNFTGIRRLGGVNINNYYMDFSRVVYTSVKQGKDQYGQPAINFRYENGMKALSEKLYEKIREDLALYLDTDLYNKHFGNSILPVVQADKIPLPEPEKELSLFDIFGISEEERGQIRQKQQTKAKSRALPVKSEGPSPEGLPAKTVVICGDSFESRLYEGVLMDYYKNGVLVENRGQVGTLSIKTQWNAQKQREDTVYTFIPLRLNQAQVDKFKSYIHLRETYFFLHTTETIQKKENPEARQMLNDRYTEFTGKYGDLTCRENRKLLQQDIFGDEMQTLEFYENGNKKLAGIFYHPVSFGADKTLRVDNAQEALAASLNKFDRVDPEYMSAISGKDEKDLIRELEGVIYYNPLSGDYEVAARFIAGDVIVKSEQIEEYIAVHPGDENLQECHKSLEALKTAIPEAIPFSDLDFNFGERWIPAAYYSEYAGKLFNTTVTIEYIADIDNFHIAAESEHTVEIREKYAVKPDYSNDISGLTILSHALVNTFPKITKPSGRYTAEGKEIRVPDLEAIQQANTKIDEIRSGFAVYLNGLPGEIRDKLSDLYNRKFNARVKPRYDGKFQTFPDLQLTSLGIDRLYDSQYDAIWMLKSNNGGIIDHEVGTGKTLTICIASHEMKRLKMAHKPMIIGLKTNIFAIAETYRKAYPNDKILYPTEKDFEPKNRMKLFHRIKNDDWDVIILTHEQFFKIPQSMEIQRDTLQRELDSVEENLKVYERLNKISSSAGMLKGLQKRQQNLKAMLSELFQKMEERRDDSIDFRTMGIDHLFIDESHEFKNLRFDTRYRYVSGLGDPQGSQRALNLLYAIRTMQYLKGKDLCATFLSGTTISNSLVELYLLFKYLRPAAMEGQGIRTFDAWAAVYAKKTSDFEFTVTNEIKSKERFRYFKNVPELANFYNEITDYRTGKDINLERPENNVMFYTTRSTPQQDEFQKKLIEFAKTGDGELIGRPGMTYDKKDSGRMLIVTDLARKASLDLRLIDLKKYHDHPDNKLSRAAKKIADYYYRFDNQRGTQFVFCDIGTYKPDKPDEWSIYGELKRKLVEDYKLHAYEVRFIQEAKNIRQREAMIAAFKQGIIRVLVGHTKSLGTGVDAPDYAVATHHIDIPWTPKDMEQRGGRGARKGNKVARLYAGNKVDNIIYASENSLDTYKFNLLQNKQTFITQLKTNSLGKRTIDEGAMDEDGNMNYSEYVAILSGNTDLLDKVKLERRISLMESEQKNYNKQLEQTGWSLKNSRLKLEQKKNRLEGIIRDWQRVETQLIKDENGIRPNPIRLNKFEGNDSIEKIGERLVVIANGMDTGGQFIEIGALLDFKILVITERPAFGTQYNRFCIEGACKYTYNNGDLARDPLLAAANFIKALDKIPSLIPKFESEIAQIEKDIPVLQEIIDTPWKRASELIRLRTELSALERKIQDTLANIDKEVEEEKPELMEIENE